jgi:Flp pilus assembly protein TadD
MSGEQPIEQKVEAKGGGTIKNVVQKAIVIGPYAGVVGIVILALAIVFASGIFNVRELRALLPTPMAFRPSNGEALIIVADFDDRSGGKYQGIDPAQYIYEQLVAQVNKDRLDVRTERLRHIVDDNTVRKTGEVYSATLVLWGWYDALTITPHMERIKPGAEYRSSEEGQHLSLADPEKVEFTVITDLPSQATYLTLFTLGMEKYASGSADQATAYLDSALAAIPQKAAASTNPSEAYLYRGNIYYYKNNYERAIADYDQSIQLKPDYAEAYYNRGVAYGDKGDYERAIADYDQAIQLKPDDAKAYNNRGSAYDHKGDYERAIADYDQAIQLKPDYAKAYYNRALDYKLEGNKDKAIADLKTFLELNNDPYWQQQAEARLKELGAR